MASQGPASPADGAVARADGIRRAFQPAYGGIHLGPRGQGCGQVLDLDYRVPRHPGRGGADLRVLLLCARQARSFLATLADPGFSRQLFQQSLVLRIERQQRDRQPRSARCRRHQDLYRAIALLSADTGRRHTGTDRLHWRTLVDFEDHGRLPDRLCNCRHPGYGTGFRQGADRAELLSTQTRSRFPLQPGTHSRERRSHRLLPRRDTGVTADRPVFQ